MAQKLSEHVDSKDSKPNANDSNISQQPSQQENETVDIVYMDNNAKGAIPPPIQVSVPQKKREIKTTKQTTSKVINKPNLVAKSLANQSEGENEDVSQDTPIMMLLALTLLISLVVSLIFTIACGDTGISSLSYELTVAEEFSFGWIESSQILRDNSDYSYNYLDDNYNSQLEAAGSFLGVMMIINILETCLIFFVTFFSI